MGIRKFSVAWSVGLALALCTFGGCVRMRKDKGDAKMNHVVDSIANADKYAGLNSGFAKAFAFLKRPDLAALPVGRYEIDGDRAWAMVQDVTLKPLETSQYEAHASYVDVQAPLSAPERFGLAETPAAEIPRVDREKDFVLFPSPAAARAVTLVPGQFAIFFPPSGAHAPCCAPDADAVGRTIRKVVIKVRAE